MEEKENKGELSEYEKKLAEELGQAFSNLVTEQGIKHFKENINKTLIGVKFIKVIGYCWAKEQAQGLGDNRQVLIFNKIYKSYCVLSLYGLSVNWQIGQNPQNYTLYQLW